MSVSMIWDGCELSTASVHFYVPLSHPMLCFLTLFANQQELPCAGCSA